MRRALLLITCLILFSVPCAAQNPGEQDLPDFEQLEQDLDWVQWLLESSRVDKRQLERIRDRVQSIRERAQTAAPGAEEKAESLRKQLAALGAPPAPDGATTESSDIAKKRDQLQEQLARHEGYLRRIELIETRGEELLGEVAEHESKATAKVILSRDASIFSRGIWRNALTQAADTPRRTTQLISDTLSRPNLGYYALIVLLIVAAAVLLRSVLRRAASPLTDNDAGRFSSAFVALVANGVLPAAGLVLASLPLLESRHVLPAEARLIESVIAAVAVLLIARAWIHVALFTRDSPRLVKLSTDITEPLARWLYALTGIVIVSFFLFQMERANIAETEFYRVSQLGLRLVIAVLFVHMFPVIRKAMQRTYETDDESSTRVIQGMYGSLFFIARIGVPALVVVNPVLISVGYWRLSDWLFFGVLGSCFLLLTIWLMRNALKELVAWNLDRLESHPPPHSSAASMPVTGSGFLWGLWLSTLTLWVGTIVGLFLIWGVPFAQVKAWANTMMFTKVAFGRVEISAVDILVALAVFFGLLALTRAVQRELQKRILSWAPLDIGVRNALWSVVGYIGVLAAIVAALMVVGVNLSQVFLIVGALSVGIGFGLQPVVHDFISGLILLLERPVRIGDWITVENEEGLVQRIGARASLMKTTLDGDIWIPNSKLTSSQVTNWTLASRAGHIRVVSTLDPDTDEQHACRIIREIADEHPSIIGSPEPEIFMERIDGDAVVLSLHAVVRSIADRFSIESDLRFALKSAYREAGIKYAAQAESDTESGARGRSMPGKYAPGRG